MKIYAARMLCFCLTAVAIFTSGGCSSLKVIETWHKPIEQVHRYQKLLILGIARDEPKRAQFENLVAAEFRRQQMVAVPGNSVIPFLNMDNTTPAAIAAAVKASGCDAVLTTRAVTVGDSKVNQGGLTGSVYGADFLASRYNFVKATLQTNLYDIATEELLWSSTITTSDADSDARVSRELGRHFIKSLKAEGFL